MSFMSVSGLLGAATFPPLNHWLIQNWGWPVAWRVWFVVLVFFFVPLALWLIRNKPEDVGLLPDNAPQVRPDSADPTLAATETGEVSWTLKEAMGTRAFWLILMCVGVVSMVHTGITFHLFRFWGRTALVQARRPLC